MQGVFEVLENKECDYDIKCNVIPNYSSQGVPKDQQDLYVCIEKVTSIIKSLEMTDKAVKTKYFKKALSIAQVGLAGPDVQTGLAMKSLGALEQEIVINEGAKIKNSYMKSLGVYALIGIILGLFAEWVFYYLKLYLINKYIIVFQGAMVGTWVSFGARKVELKFEELSIIEKDRLNPIIRLMFVGISAVILLLFINSEVITFSIGGFKSKDIVNYVELQLLIGIVAGLLEYKAGIGLFNKASSIIKF